MCKKGKETMSTLEIYFWLLLPVYLVGALTIANWLASWTDYYVRLYKEKKLEKKTTYNYSYVNVNLLATYTL